MAKKTAHVTFEVNDDVTENQFKDWVKTCPHSPEGGQSLSWGYAQAEANTAGEGGNEAGEEKKDAA